MIDRIKPDTNFYVDGGTLRADAPSYIRRQADRELYEHILKGDFCCVLTPRQMGKSSLMIRTADRLKKEDHRTAIIDLTQIGTGKEKTSADKWYYGIAYRMVRELDIKIKLSEWWQEREKLPALQRLTEFFEDVLLPGTHEPIVIFVDEIDTTIALPFTDDFFAAVRACYNARAANPAYQQLNFVLLGVAAPSDLIKDAQRTPFNIGHGIRLGDFTLEEAKPLSLGLCADPAQGEKMLARILYWTGGHPYLTQKLCRITADEKLAVHSDEAIDNLVEKNFLSPGVNRQEPNLKFVSDRLLQDRKNSRKRLKLYRRVYREKPVLDDPLSPTHATLKLSGLLVPRTKQMLSIRNRIYERVFTGEWIKEVIPTNWNRNIAVATIIFLLIFLLFYYIQLSIWMMRSAQEDVPTVAYNILKRMPFYKTTAKNLFADYWHRRALRSERQENLEAGLIYYLKALSIKESAILRSEAGRVIGYGYMNLISTYRRNRLIPDGKTVLTGSEKTSLGGYRDWLMLIPTLDGIWGLVSNKGGTMRFWTFSTKKELAPSIEHDSKVSSVAFKPDGKTVLTGSDDGTARLWQADTGKPISPNITHGSSINSVAFSPDGKTVLTGSSDGTARLWQAATGKPVSSPMKHDSSISSMAFSSDGKFVLTGSDDGTAKLWETATGNPVSSPIKHGLRITSVAFSPDGKTVLTGSDDGTAKLWETATGNPVSSPMKHGLRVTSVAFSRDGKTVLTGSDDGTAKLWEAATGKPVSSLIKHGSLVYSIAFSPDGKTIMAATDRWVHQSILSNETTKPKASRLLPGRWTLLPGSWTGAYRFLDDKGDEMQVAVRITGIIGITGDSIRIINLRFDKPDAPPLQGDPEELLELWQEKLALRLDEKTGKIEPLYQ
jgi:hypothetical protein